MDELIIKDVEDCYTRCPFHNYEWDECCHPDIGRRDWNGFEYDCPLDKSSIIIKKVKR